MLVKGLAFETFVSFLSESFNFVGPWSKLRGLLNRPQRERLPRFQVGILMIGKVEPTVTIRAELRLLFPEIQFIEFTPVVFGNLHGY
jgi:hypothetical protein